MALPPIPFVIGDLLQGRIVCSSQKQFAYNIRHWRVDAIGAGGAPDLQSLCTAMDNIIVGTYKPILSPEAEYQGFGLRRIVGGVLPPSLEVHNVTNLGVGTSVGDILPRQACGIATLQTAFPGRANRGRFYAAFPGEDDNSADGTPTTAYLVRLRALMNVVATPTTFILPGAMAPVTLAPIVYHRAAHTQTDIVNYVDRDRWATQRRRSDFGALNANPWN